MPGTPYIHDPQVVANAYVSRHPDYAACRVHGHLMRQTMYVAREPTPALAGGFTSTEVCFKCGGVRTGFYDWGWVELRNPKWCRPKGWGAFGIGSDVTVRHLRVAMYPVEGVHVSDAVP